MNEDYKYPGEELILFNNARKWKKYFSKTIKKHTKGNVLEVGAGIGNNTLLLNDGSFHSWLLLEPDSEMATTLQEKIRINKLPANCKCENKTIFEINESFDTIIYIDVLEHIQADTAELEKAFNLLNPGGKIIILSPAFNHLYIAFDKAIGHYRRYTSATLKKIFPENSRLIFSRYYDCAGYFGLLINKIFLNNTVPTKRKILLWDNILVPLSTVLDKLTFHQFGKSIICILVKE